MKKKFLFLITIFASSYGFAKPFSFSNLYVSGFAGANFTNHIEDSGYAVGAACGYKLSKLFRFEGEFAHRSNAYKHIVIDRYFIFSAYCKLDTAIANGIIDLPIFDDTLIPYLGIGIGRFWSRNHCVVDHSFPNEQGLFSILSNKVTRYYGFAYQGIVGLTFFSFKNMQAAFEYRCLREGRFTNYHFIGLNIKTYF